MIERVSILLGVEREGGGCLGAGCYSGSMCLTDPQPGPERSGIAFLLRQAADMPLIRWELPDIEVEVWLTVVDPVDRTCLDMPPRYH